MHLYYIKLYMIADIKKWAKVTTLDIEAKFMLCSKWVIDSIEVKYDRLE